MFGEPSLSRGCLASSGHRRSLPLATNTLLTWQRIGAGNPAARANGNFSNDREAACRRDPRLMMTKADEVQAA